VKNAFLLVMMKNIRIISFFNPITKKFIVNRDVVFKEEESWDGNIDKTITGTIILYEEQREKVQGEQSNEQGGIPSRIPQE
jgi:hypothetical protein